MRGGNNIKSTKDKLLAGTSRADRDAGRLENFVAKLSVTPEPPKGFDKQHKKKWNEIGGKMVELGVLSVADLDALTLLVQNMVMLEKAHASILQEGMVIVVQTAKGPKSVTNPSYRIYTECQKLAKPLLEQFGMTPKARQSLKVQEPEQEDPLADLLRGSKKRGNGPHD